MHRHQVLRRDLRGRPLPAPVVYAGSVERTSFAEREETKGFVLATVAAGGRGGRLEACEFRPLPARPMRVHEVRDGRRLGLEQELRGRDRGGAPPDVVLQLRVPEALAGHEALRAERLRCARRAGRERHGRRPVRELPRRTGRHPRAESSRLASAPPEFRAVGGGRGPMSNAPCATS